jgi:anion-transporting  ArsA/GET3 family ATPase
VKRHAKKPQARDRILNNENYRQVSSQLAGTQAYMALEKLLSVADVARYDSIVLDSPPTAHALDFLDAPVRLVELVDNPALKGLMGAFEGSGRFSLNLVAHGVRRALSAMGQITGVGLIERVAEFAAGLNDLFGGFRERAERVSRALSSPSAGYLMVASPALHALDQVHAFAERLNNKGLSGQALIVNRVEPGPMTPIETDALRAAVERRSLGVPLERLSAALLEQARLSERDHSLLEGMTVERYGSLARLPRLLVPAFSDDVHGLAALNRVAMELMATDNHESGRGTRGS